jgi:hypothetical protein
MQRLQMQQMEQMKRLMEPVRNKFSLIFFKIYDVSSAAAAAPKRPIRRGGKPQPGRKIYDLK